MSNYIEHPASGNTGTFTAKYDQHAERNGQTFTVLGAVDPKAYDATECGEMFSIRFTDGVQIEAWPEEVALAVNAIDSPQRDFLRELSRLSGQSFDSLVKAGYTESVSVYLKEGKTPRQVANVMASSMRHGQASEVRNMKQYAYLQEQGYSVNTKVFDFKINQQRHPDGSVPEAQMISVAMTQEQFEDHQTKRDFVHDGIRAIGLNPAEVVWFESPPIDEVTERAFKEHIGAAPDAQLIAYYPHSVHHRHYKEATLNGVKYLYMSFQNGHFIKFAQSVNNLNSEQAPA